MLVVQTGGGVVTGAAVVAAAVDGDGAAVVGVEAHDNEHTLLQQVPVSHKPIFLS